MLTASLCFLMFAYAFSCTTLGPMLPSLRAEYGLTLSQSGLMTTLQGVGGTLAVLAGVMISDALKRSSLITSMFFLYGLSVLFIVFLPFYQALLVLFFLIGASTRLVESVLNAYVFDLHPENPGFYLILVHAGFGVGALLGPILSSVVLSRGMHWNRVFLSLAALCFVALIVYVASEAKNKRRTGKMEMTAFPVLLALLTSRRTWVLGLITMVYVGFANGYSVWAPSYVREVFHVSDLWGSFPVTALWLGIIAGRLIYSFLSLRYKANLLLFVSNLVAAVVSVIAVAVNTYVSVTLGFAIAGFLIAATNPLAFSLLNEMYPKNRGAVFSATMFTGSLGLMTIPWLAGFVAERSGFWWGLLVLGLCPGGLLALSSALLFDRKSA